MGGKMEVYTPMRPTLRDRAGPFLETVDTDEDVAITLGVLDRRFDEVLTRSVSDLGIQQTKSNREELLRDLAMKLHTATDES